MDTITIASQNFFAMPILVFHAHSTNRAKINCDRCHLIMEEAVQLNNVFRASGEESKAGLRTMQVRSEIVAKLAFTDAR